MENPGVVIWVGLFLVVGLAGMVWSLIGTSMASKQGRTPSTVMDHLGLWSMGLVMFTLFLFVFVLDKNGLLAVYSALAEGLVVLGLVCVRVVRKRVSSTFPALLALGLGTTSAPCAFFLLLGNDRYWKIIPVTWSFLLRCLSCYIFAYCVLTAVFLAIALFLRKVF